MAKIKRKPFDLTFYQGDDISYTLKYEDQFEEPIDLTGYNCYMQARLDYQDAAPIFELEVGTGITITPETGEILIEISSAITSTLSEKYYLYDIELEAPGGDIKTILFGKILVLAEVTK